MTALALDPGCAKRGIVPIPLCIVPFSQIPLDGYTPAPPQIVAPLSLPAARDATQT